MVNLCQLENYAAARRVPTVLVAEKEFDDHHLHGHRHHGCNDRSRIYNVSPLNPFSIFVNSHLGSTAPPTDTTSSPFLTSDTLGANIEN